MDGCTVLCTCCARARSSIAPTGCSSWTAARPPTDINPAITPLWTPSPPPTKTTTTSCRSSSPRSPPSCASTSWTGRVLTVAQAGPGRGSTTVSLLLADALADRTGCTRLVLRLSSDDELRRGLADEQQRSPLRLGDLLDDLPEFDDRSLNTHRRVTRVRGCARARGLVGLGRRERARPPPGAGRDRVRPALLRRRRRRRGRRAGPCARGRAARACDDVMLIDTSDEVEEAGDREVLATIEREAPGPAILVLNQVETGSPAGSTRAARPAGATASCPPTPSCSGCWPRANWTVAAWPAPPASLWTASPSWSQTRSHPRPARRRRAAARPHVAHGARCPGGHGPGARARHGDPRAGP